ncbi:hypothetical protein VTL71DRAFT_9214, partial [Oculimacula yallundae]
MLTTSSKSRWPYEPSFHPAALLPYSRPSMHTTPSSWCNIFHVHPSTGISFRIQIKSSCPHILTANQNAMNLDCLLGNQICRTPGLEIII